MENIEKPKVRKRPKRGRRIKRDDLRKGIYILPNLITSIALFAGFFSIISSIEGNFELAAWAILVAAVFDAIDGKVARLTGTESEFGVQYDSLSDLVSFGMAPAILMYQWALDPFVRGWLGAALYVICVALRLARFNVQVTTVEKSVFNGMPSPPSALMLASLVVFFKEMNISIEDWRPFILIMIYFMGFLMVSNVKYSSFKEIDVAKRRPFHILFLIILIATLVATRPEIMLFALISMYTLSGPMSLLFKALMKGKGKDDVGDKESDEIEEMI